MEPSQATTEAAPVANASATVDAPPAVDPSALPPAIDRGEETIAPGIERLGRPRGSARDVPMEYPGKSPSFAFLIVVSVVSLVSDIGTKLWAEANLDGYPGIVHVWQDHVAFVLAKNRGGAWGLLQSTNENVRRPFFLLVSAAAIAFIVTLYRRLLPSQRALKWGLPLVLGGALGNVFDRIRYGHVIDFIDFHMKWKGEDHHWPTFNVADIAICVGVGLMAIDMFTAKRPKRLVVPPPASSASTDALALAADAGQVMVATGGEVPLEPVAAEPSPSAATDVPETRPDADGERLAHDVPAGDSPPEARGEGTVPSPDAASKTTE